MSKKTEEISTKLALSNGPESSALIKKLQHKIASLEKELTQTKQSKRYLQSLLNTQQSSFILLDNKINILAFNQFAYKRNLTLRKKELKKGEPIKPFVPEERWEIFRDSVNKTFLGESVNYIGSVQGKWFNVHYEPVLEDDKTIACAYYSRDITEIRQAELALKESEERYRKLVEGSPIPTIVHSDHKFVFINSAALKAMGGKSSKQYIGQSVYAFLHDDIYDIGRAWIERTYQLNQSLREEIKFTKKDGKVLHAMVAINQINYQGKPAVQVAFNNISALKETEKQLRRSELMLSKAQSLAHLGSFEMDINTGKSSWSDELYRLLGYEPKAVSGTFENFVKHIHPNDRDTIVQINEHLLDMHKPANFKFRVIRTDNEIRHLEAEILTAFDKENNPRKVYGALLDVTQRVKAAEALAESERLYRLLAENTKDLVCLHDPDGTYRWVSPSSKDILGYEPSELIDRSPYELFHPEDAKMIREESHEPIQQGVRKSEPVVMRIQRKDGQYIWFESQVQPFFNEKNELIQIETSSRDITERKLAVEALKKEKDTVQTYLDLSGALFVIVDKHMKVQLINQRGCEILEGTEEEIVGKSWFDEFMYETDQVEFKARFTRILSKKRPIKDFSENRIKSCKGNLRIIAWKNMLLRDEAGNPIGILSSGEDITERRRLERENITAMLNGQEQERKRFAGELHDGLALLLSTAKMHVTNLETDRELLPKSKQGVFDSMQKLIDDAIGEIRSMVADLQPRILENFGLIAALEELCEKLSPTKVKLHFYKVGIIGRLPSEIETGIYRIAQELIGNALKHAKASNIVVQLIRHEQSIMLMVDDDGVGFDQTTQLKHRVGYGFNNIKSRTSSLQGDIIIDSAPNKGTIATVEIPLNIQAHD